MGKVIAFKKINNPPSSLPKKEDNEEITKFKLAVLSNSSFSDSDIEKLFVDLSADTEEELLNVIDFLTKHRPQVVRAIEQKYCR